MHPSGHLGHYSLSATSAVDANGVWVKSGSAEVRDAGVLMGKCGSAFYHVTTKSSKHFAMYNARVREYDCYICYAIMKLTTMLMLSLL